MVNHDYQLVRIWNNPGNKSLGLSLTGFLYQVNYNDKAVSNDMKYHGISQGQTKSEEGLEPSIGIHLPLLPGCSPTMMCYLRHHDLFDPTTALDCKVNLTLLLA